MAARPGEPAMGARCARSKKRGPDNRVRRRPRSCPPVTTPTVVNGGGPGRRWSRALTTGSSRELSGVLSRKPLTCCRSITRSDQPSNHLDECLIDIAAPPSITRLATTGQWPRINLELIDSVVHRSMPPATRACTVVSDRSDEADWVRHG
jgi:hypothetical protein